MKTLRKPPVLWPALMAGMFMMVLIGCASEPENTPPAAQEPAAAEHSADDGHGHDHGHTHDNSPSGQLHGIMLHPMVMPLTGDVDQDFAGLMIGHHQAGIAMSSVLLQHGKNDELKKIAESIMATQGKEIDALMPHAPTASSTSTEVPADAPSRKLHEVMVHPVDDYPLTKDVDKDFAGLMIIHHEGAIEMAKIQLQHGKNDALKSMAQTMIDVQTKEIEQLKKFATPQE